MSNTDTDPQVTSPVIHCSLFAWRRWKTTVQFLLDRPWSVTLSSTVSIGWSFVCCVISPSSLIQTRNPNGVPKIWRSPIPMNLLSRDLICYQWPNHRWYGIDMGWFVAASVLGSTIGWGNMGGWGPCLGTDERESVSNQGVSVSESTCCNRFCII